MHSLLFYLWYRLCVHVCCYWYWNEYGPQWLRHSCCWRVNLPSVVLLGSIKCISESDSNLTCAKIISTKIQFPLFIHAFFYPWPWSLQAVSFQKGLNEEDMAVSVITVYCCSVLESWPCVPVTAAAGLCGCGDSARTLC